MSYPLHTATGCQSHQFILHTQIEALLIRTVLYNGRGNKNYTVLLSCSGLQQCDVPIWSLHLGRRRVPSVERVAALPD
jgi:hypothetical protein